MKLKTKIFGLLLFFFWGWERMTLMGQCSQCKAAASSRDEAGNLIIGESINFGVLYLLAFPIVLSLTVGGIWWWKSRQFALSHQEEHGQGGEPGSDSTYSDHSMSSL